MDLTLVELHLEDASFTAHAPFSGGSDPGDGSGEPHSTTGETDEPDDPVDVRPILIGLVALLALAYLVRRRRNGHAEP